MNNKTIVFFLVIIWLFISLYDIIYYDFVEQFTVGDWILKYYKLILFVSIILGIFLSKKALHIKENVKKIWRAIIYILMASLMSFISFAIIFALLQGGILMTNRIIGKQTDYEIKGIVISTSRIISRGGFHYYIKLDDKALSRPINFRVKNEYSIGDSFKKTVKKGSLGLLYFKD